jgi:hypothetical protein
MGLGGWSRTDGLYPLRAKSTLSLLWVKPEVCDSILANLSFLLGNLISSLPQKGEKEVSSFHTILLRWPSQQKVNNVLKECTAMLGG